MMHKLPKAIIRASAAIGTALMLALPVSVQAQVEINYNLPSAETIAERKANRKNQVVSERTGRRIMSAFELYEEDNLDGAIEILEDTSTRDEFDLAYVNRFLGAFYAQVERHDEAIRLLKQTVDSDQLGWGDHTASLKMLADLYLQTENYEQALRYYGQWLQFTGEADPSVFLRIANSYYELKQFDKIIQPADLAIENFDEPNKNPYILKVASYYEREMFGEAVKVLEVALNYLPEEKGWWSQLAQFYMLEEQIAKALETMEIAYLAGYLDKENHYKVLVQLYANNGVPYKAATLMVKHIEAGDIEATERNYQSAGSNFEAAREFGDAARVYGLAAELAEDNEAKANQYRRQGVAHIRAEEYEQAATALNRALELGYDDAGSLYMSLAEAYLYTRDYRDALDAATSAMEYEDVRRNARSWSGYIRNIAERRGVSL